MTQQVCSCGWFLPREWGVHIHFSDGCEEVVELPEGVEDPTDDMKITVQLRCPQCNTLLMVEPDGVMAHELEQGDLN